MYKNANVTYDINSHGSNGSSTNIQFMTQDTGSAKLSFSFTKDGVPLPLSAVDAKIVLLYPDGSFYKKSLTLVDKVNGKAEYILSDEELKHPGIVKAELKLYYTNGQALATSFFTFTISKTLEDQNIVPAAEYYIDDFETFRAGINKTMDEISQTVEELKAKFADLENIETKDGAQEKANAAESNAIAYTDKHANNKDNPHKVTKAQIGLSEVMNVKQAAKIDFDVHNQDSSRHITSSERTKWNEAESKVNDHLNSKSNPHNVTTKQINLINDSAFQDASYDGNNYPDGISTFPLLANEAIGYPGSYGGILNVKSTQYRFAQFFLPAGNIKDPRISIRYWYHSLGWTDFMTLVTSTDLGAAEKQIDALKQQNASLSLQVARLQADVEALKGGASS
ncbi:phage baseplate upper protein [Bacillus subtilis]|nr:phage baseplate upper protein [Bacillus subtilis]MDM5301908.1 phage baseplate upper protein [Bacillus subtilis]MDM5323961.1 phage baseplate upper protein [Bacillus subtilis]